MCKRLILILYSPYIFYDITHRLSDHDAYVCSSRRKSVPLFVSRGVPFVSRGVPFVPSVPFACAIYTVCAGTKGLCPDRFQPVVLPPFCPFPFGFLPSKKLSQIFRVSVRPKFWSPTTWTVQYTTILRAQISQVFLQHSLEMTTDKTCT